MDASVHLAERQDRRGRRLASVSMLAVIVVPGASLFGLFSFLEANSAFGTVEDVADAMLCDPDDYDLGLPDVGSLSEVYTFDGVLLGKLTLRNSQPVPIDEVPDLVRWAVVIPINGSGSSLALLHRQTPTTPADGIAVDTRIGPRPREGRQSGRSQRSGAPMP